MSLDTIIGTPRNLEISELHKALWVYLYANRVETEQFRVLVEL
jgi:hypothetical protein